MTQTERLIIAFDGQDEEAIERRKAVRDSHLAFIKPLTEQGHLVHGGAILNEQGEMIGSMVLTNFPTQHAFDEWMKNDPYIKEGVWHNIQVLPFKTAALFYRNLTPLAITQ